MSRKSWWHLLIVICVIAAFAPNPAKARYEGWGSSFYSGEELSRLCKSEDPLQQHECSSYICGVYDGWLTLEILGKLPNDRNLPYDICLPPKGVTVTCEELRQAVLKEFDANPEIRKSGGGGVVGMALHRTFPCCWDPLLSRPKQPPPPGCPQ
jgi:hypothetical protein